MPRVQKNWNDIMMHEPYHEAHNHWLDRLERKLGWWLWLAICMACGFVAGSLLPGCSTTPKSDRLRSPYARNAVVAVAPFRNESGTSRVDGVIMADKMARQLELVDGLVALPVDRVLAGMQAMQIRDITTPAEAEQLRDLIGADGLVIGTVTTYDAYDPPKLGLTVEMFTSKQLESQTLARAVQQQNQKQERDWFAPNEPIQNQPFSNAPAIVSHLYDAADAHTRDELQRFARSRGAQDHLPENWRTYRMDMHRYTTFVCYATVARLMHVENLRLHPSEIKHDF